MQRVYGFANGDVELDIQQCGYKAVDFQTGVFGSSEYLFFGGRGEVEDGLVRRVLEDFTGSGGVYNVSGGRRR